MLFNYSKIIQRSPLLCGNCPNTEWFLVRIFPHLNWIRRGTSYLSVFSPNAGKYGPEITPYLDTFHAALAFDKWGWSETHVQALSMSKFDSNTKVRDFLTAARLKFHEGQTPSFKTKLLENIAKHDTYKHTLSQTQTLAPVGAATLDLDFNLNSFVFFTNWCMTEKHIDKVFPRRKSYIQS